ncbi:nickel pincer cofactor biosynthesis protein LarC [Nitrososphaera sp.]|uniref:nickel pincer cofactor biosynthesis protein LarC n=1 Tax=Nitrososphaera sp. TaxID=1971748 RepID=UPI002EDB2352
MAAKVAVIDCQIAGIAGDMLVSALVDAGADRKKVANAILACQKFLKGSKITKVSFNKITTHGFSATQLTLSCNDGVHERKGSEMINALEKTCDSLELAGKARRFARGAMKSIISAEAAIHGESPDNVHLHEASSVDTLADIVACAVALDDLGLFDAQVYSTRVAVGAGKLKFSHGTVPNPADAVLHIFKGRQFVLEGGQAKDELATPTGAALLASIAQKSVDYYPPIITEKIGYGTGCKEFAGFANLVRVTIGTAPSAVEKDTICLVETNIDDATGETLGNLIERLTDAGAKDVTVLTGTGKKGRPAHLVRVICDNQLQNAVLDVLFSETGTLGARVQQVERVVLPRTILTVPVKIAGSTFQVHVKVVKDAAGNVKGAKPEFEDIKIISTRCNMPARRVAELVSVQVAKKTGAI